MLAFIIFGIVYLVSAYIVYKTVQRETFDIGFIDILCTFLPFLNVVAAYAYTLEHFHKSGAYNKFYRRKKRDIV